MFGGVLLARQHFHVQHQAQFADKPSVQRMARAARFVRIITDLRAFLLPIDGLDRHIHVQDPPVLEQRFPGLGQGLLLPRGAQSRIQAFEGQPNAVLRTNLTHAQADRIDLVAPQRRDVGITVMASEDGQSQGAQHILFGRGVGAGVDQRTVPHPIRK
jgi:hypothetical protein